MSATRPPRPRPQVRVQPADQRAGEDVAEVASLPAAPLPVPRSHDPGRLRSLADAAREAVAPDERQAATTPLVDLLVALRDVGNEPAEAKAILELLDLRLLHDLVDERGRSARREAVETLTSLGFPWAMHVAVEDLRHARDWTPPGGAATRDGSAALTEWERRLARSRRFAAGFAAAGQLGAVLFEAAQSRGQDHHLGAAVVAGLVGLVPAVAFVVKRPNVEDQVAYGSALLVGAVGSLLLLMVAGPSGVFSLMGTGAALLAAFGWQAEPAGSNPASLQHDYDKWREAQRHK